MSGKKKYKHGETNNMYKSLTKNYVFSFFKTFCGIAFPLITFMYASRVLGTEGIGKVNFAKSFITYFAMVAMLGINQYGTREAAKLRDDRKKLTKFTHEVVAINILTTFFAFFMLFVSIRFIYKLKNYTALLWINSITIFMQGLGMEWLYQAEEEYEYITKRAVVFQLIALVLLFVFVRDSNDLVKYTYINVFSTSGSYILNFLYSRRFVDWGILSGYEIKKHLPGMLWLFAMAASIELYTVLDSTMLGFICGDRAVGLYTAAIRVNKLTNSLITALGVVLIPRLSYYIGRNETKKMNDLVCKGYNYVFLMSIPAAIGLFCLGDNIVYFLCGIDYEPAVLTLRIMTPIVILITFSVMTNNQTFVPLGKEKLILLSTCIGAATNIMLNGVLIPKFAQNGAAVATVISETTVAGVCLLNSVKLLNMKEVFKCYYQYWIAAVPIFLITYIVKRSLNNYIVQMGVIIAISGVMYALILYILKNEYFVYLVERVENRFLRDKN